MMDDQRIKLTDAEMVGRSRTLAQLIARHARVKEERKAMNADFKAQLEDIEKEVAKIAAEINQGSRPADDAIVPGPETPPAEGPKPRRKYTLDPQKTMSREA